MGELYTGSMSVLQTSHRDGIQEEHTIFLARLAGDIDESTGHGTMRELTALELIEYTKKAGLTLGEATQDDQFLRIQILFDNNTIGSLTLKLKEE